MSDLKFLDLEPLRHTIADLSTCRPVDVNTKGVKVPCLTSSTLREYKRFSHSRDSDRSDIMVSLQ